MPPPAPNRLMVLEWMVVIRVCCKLEAHWLEKNHQDRRAHLTPSLLRLSAVGLSSPRAMRLQLVLAQKCAAAGLSNPRAIVADGAPARQSQRGSGRPQRGDVAWAPPPAVALPSSSRARSRSAPPRAAGSTRRAEPTWPEPARAEGAEAAAAVARPCSPRHCGRRERREPGPRPLPLLAGPERNEGCGGGQRERVGTRQERQRGSARSPPSAPGGEGGHGRRGRSGRSPAAMGFAPALAVAVAPSQALVRRRPRHRRRPLPLHPCCLLARRPDPPLGPAPAPAVPCAGRPSPSVPCAGRPTLPGRAPWPPREGAVPVLPTAPRPCSPPTPARRSSSLPAAAVPSSPGAALSTARGAIGGCPASPRPPCPARRGRRLVRALAVAAPPRLIPSRPEQQQEGGATGEVRSPTPPRSKGRRRAPWADRARAQRRLAGSGRTGLPWPPAEAALPRRPAPAEGEREGLRGRESGEGGRGVKKEKIIMTRGPHSW